MGWYTNRLRNWADSCTLPVMPWWGWLLTAWAVLATAVGVLLGAIAAKARARERHWRLHQYVSAPEED